MSACVLPTAEGFAVDGEVSFRNVLQIRTLGEAIIAARSSVVIDLSQMKEQDASALSLLLCWQRFANKNNKNNKNKNQKKQCTLRITHISSSLQRMSQLFGISLLSFLSFEQC